MVVVSIDEEKALHEMGMSKTPDGWSILGVAVDNNERGALVQMPSRRFCIMHKTGGKRVAKLDAVNAFIEAVNKYYQAAMDKVVKCIVGEPPHPECFDCKATSCDDCTVKGYKDETVLDAE